MEKNKGVKFLIIVGLDSEKHLPHDSRFVGSNLTKIDVIFKWTIEVPGTTSLEETLNQ